MSKKYKPLKYDKKGNLKDIDYSPVFKLYAGGDTNPFGTGKEYIDTAAMAKAGQYSTPADAPSFSTNDFIAAAGLASSVGNLISSSIKPDNLQHAGNEKQIQEGVSAQQQNDAILDTTVGAAASAVPVVGAVYGLSNSAYGLIQAGQESTNPGKVNPYTGNVQYEPGSVEAMVATQTKPHHEIAFDAISDSRYKGADQVGHVINSIFNPVYAIGYDSGVVGADGKHSLRPDPLYDPTYQSGAEMPKTASGYQGAFAKNGGQLWKKYGGKLYANGGNTSFTTTQQDNGLVILNGKDHNEGGIDLKEGIEVEGGETIWNDFVFTNSHKIDKATADKFNLPKGSVNNTFAKASKNYVKYLNEHPHDPYAKEEFAEHMERLQEAHLAAVPQSRPENIQTEAVNANLQGFGPQAKNGGNIAWYVSSVPFANGGGISTMAANNLIKLQDGGDVLNRAWAAFESLLGSQLDEDGIMTLPDTPTAHSNIYGGPQYPGLRTYTMDNFSPYINEIKENMTPHDQLVAIRNMYTTMMNNGSIDTTKIPEEVANQLQVLDYVSGVPIEELTEMVPKAQQSTEAPKAEQPAEPPKSIGVIDSAGNTWYPRADGTFANSDGDVITDDELGEVLVPTPAIDVKPTTNPTVGSSFNPKDKTLLEDAEEIIALDADDDLDRETVIGGPTPTTTPTTSPATTTSQKTDSKDRPVNVFEFNTQPETKPFQPTEEQKKKALEIVTGANPKKKPKTKTKTPWSEHLRYAPVGTSLANLAIALSNKPKAINSDKFLIKDKYQKQRIDKELLQRETDNQSADLRNALAMGATTQSGLMAGLAAISAGTAKAKTDAVMKGQLFDAEQGQLAEQFERQADVANSQTRLQIQNMNDANQAAYLSEIMNSIAEVGQNVGAVGIDEANRNRANKMFAYDTKGEFSNPGMISVPLAMLQNTTDQNLAQMWQYYGGNKNAVKPPKK